jgi:hypothetical protein
MSAAAKGLWKGIPYLTNFAGERCSLCISVRLMRTESACESAHGLHPMLHEQV